MRSPRVTPAITQITGPEVGYILNKTEQILPLLWMDVGLILVYRFYQATVSNLLFIIRTKVLSRYFEIKF